MYLYIQKYCHRPVSQRHRNQETSSYSRIIMNYLYTAPSHEIAHIHTYMHTYGKRKTHMAEKNAKRKTRGAKHLSMDYGAATTPYMGEAWRPAGLVSGPDSIKTTVPGSWHQLRVRSVEDSRPDCIKPLATSQPVNLPANLLPLLLL